MEKPRYILEAQQIVRMYDGVVCENNGFYDHMEAIGDKVEQLRIEASARRKIDNMEDVVDYLGSNFYYGSPSDDGSILMDVTVDENGEPLTLTVNKDLIWVIKGMIESQWEYSNFFVSEELDS
jgi:hypothetical protein